MKSAEMDWCGYDGKTSFWSWFICPFISTNQIIMLYFCLFLVIEAFVSDLDDGMWWRMYDGHPTIPLVEQAEDTRPDTIAGYPNDGSYTAE